MSYLKNEDLRDIIAFLSNKYINVNTAILSGSTIDGTADTNSDLDIVLIVSDRNLLYNETIRFKHYKLQTFIIPLQHIYEKLYEDFINARCHFIGLLAKGIYLYGDQKLSISICKHSKELKDKGPKPMSNRNYLDARIHITQLIDKLSNTNEKWEDLILYVGQLTDLLIGFKLHSEGAWKGGGKHRMKFLEEHDSKFKNDLIRAMEMAFNEKDYTDLIELSKNEIKEKGGLVELYSKDIIELTPNDDFVCVCIKFFGDYEKRKYLLLELYNSLLKLKKLSSINFSYYFYTTYLSGEMFSENDVFCIIHADNGWLNNFLIDWLYEFKKDNHFDEMTFPIFIDPKFKFVSKSLYKEVLPIFVKSSYFYLEKPEQVFDEGYQISFAILYFKKLNDFYFFNKNGLFKEFLLFTLKGCFVYSYDSKERINSLELLKRRETSFLQFEETFQSQKEILQELWKEENHFFVISELKTLIDNLAILKSDLDSFPDYFSHYLDKKNIYNANKEVLLLKELSLKYMEILLIEASFMPYILYTILRLIKVPFKLIKVEIQ